MKALGRPRSSPDSGFGSLGEGGLSMPTLDEGFQVTRLSVSPAPVLCWWRVSMN
jgi:hypothetical protein